MKKLMISILINVVLLCTVIVLVSMNTNKQQYIEEQNKRIDNKELVIQRKDEYIDNLVIQYNKLYTLYESVTD